MTAHFRKLNSRSHDVPKSASPEAPPAAPTDTTPEAASDAPIDRHLAADIEAERRERVINAALKAKGTEDEMPTTFVQMAPDPAGSVWDAVIRFPDGFELAVDRWPTPNFKPGALAVPPQRMRLEGWFCGVKMFAATINLVGGTQVQKR